MARTTNGSKNAALAAKKSTKVIKKNILNTMCKAIHEVATKNKGKLPYGYMRLLVKENKKTCRWVTRDILNSAYTRYKKKILLDP